MMITNNSITYYHKNDTTDKWDRYFFEDVWVFSGKGSNINKGYENSNNVSIRIPMDKVNDKSIFNIEDIVVVGSTGDIEMQSDLRGHEFYNITSVTINEFGSTPHVHLGGK